MRRRGVQVEVESTDDTKHEHPKDELNRGISTPWLLGMMAAAAALAAACYANTVDAHLVFDDTGAVVDNADVTGPGGLLARMPGMFTRDFWGNPMALSLHKSYRPITILTFRFDFIRSGSALEPSAFHTTNIFLHAIATCLVVPFTHAWIAPYGGRSGYAGLASAILFATHTIHTEAVAGIVGRADVLCTLLFLLSSLLYKHAIGPSQGAAALLSRLFAYSFSVLLICASVLCKETGITSLATLAALDAINGGISPLNLRHRGGARAWAYIYRFAGLAAVALLVIAARLWIMGGTPRFTRMNNPAAFEDDLSVRYMTYWHIYALNARLLLFPLPRSLSCDWSMGAVPLVNSPFDTRNVPSLALFVLLIASSLYIAKQSLFHFPSRAGNQFSASIILICVPFIPAANLFFTVGFAVAERVLYLPSLGYCVALACAWDASFIAAAVKCDKKRDAASSSSILRWFILAAVAGLYAIGTVERNRDWSTSKRIFASSIRATPLNAKLYHNLAHVTCETRAAQDGLLSEEVMSECKRLYDKAISLSPDFADAMGGYGVLIQESDTEKAVFLLERAVALDPHNKLAHKNAADLLARKQIDFDRSKIYFENALKLDPSYADAHNNYGNLLLVYGDMKKVEFHYREALRLNPQHPNARDNIDRFFSSSGAGDHSQSQVVSPRGKKENKGNKGNKGKNKDLKKRGGDDKTGGPSGRGGDVKDFGGMGGDSAAAKAASSEAKPKGKREKRKGASKKEGGGSSSSSKGNGRPAGDAGDGQVAGMSTWGIQEYKAALAAGVCAGKVEKNCRNNLGVLLFQNGKGSEALEHLDRAVELDPSWAEATYNLGYVKKELANPKP